NIISVALRFSYIILLPTTSILFPYTTLFRSAKYLRENSRTCSNKLFIARAKNGTPGGPSLRVCPPGKDADPPNPPPPAAGGLLADRKSTRLNSSHVSISYAVFCLKKKNYYIH